MRELSYEHRLAIAKASYANGLRRVKQNPEPPDQKFHVGDRVRIVETLPRVMSHFPGAGKLATVEHTYNHAFCCSKPAGEGGQHEYSLKIDGYGSVAWYPESLLEAVTE